MKKLYQTLKTLPKTYTRIELGIITLKCPDYIANALLDKPRTESRETRPWWYNYPAVDARPTINNTIEYQPKYR